MDSNTAGREFPSEETKPIDALYNRGVLQAPDTQPKLIEDNGQLGVEPVPGMRIGPIMSVGSYVKTGNVIWRVCALNTGKNRISLQLHSVEGFKA